MSIIILTALFGFFGQWDAVAQSRLPSCPTNARPSSWNNCFGTLSWVDGRKYVGDFRIGMLNGQGVYTWPNGVKYVGEFRDDKRNGQGTYTWADGAKYVGEFRDDNFYGRGTMTMPDGTEKKGIWAGDVLVKEEIQSKAANHLSDFNLKLFMQIASGFLAAGLLAAGVFHIFRNAKPVTSTATSMAPPTRESAKAASEPTRETVSPAEAKTTSLGGQSNELSQVLDRLNKLHATGILTDDEFEQEKKRILDN